jgi:muramidase (phage lysozyme)
MDRYDYLQAALKDPWVRAYLKTIQHNEGTDRGGRGYATYFRYYDNGETPDETLRSYHLHWMPIGNGKFSSASGAYQIINKTYRGLQDIFNRTGVFQRMGVRPDSWSPEVQDMMAVELLNENGILRRLLAHDPGVLTAGNKTWASFGVKSPQSTAAAFNHYLQQEGQPPVTVKINGQDFNGAGLSYAGGAPAGGMPVPGGMPGSQAFPGYTPISVADVDWTGGGQGGSSPMIDGGNNWDYFGGYRPQSAAATAGQKQIVVNPEDTLETAGVNTPYNRATRAAGQPVPMGLSNLVLSPETDISDSKKGINNRAFMINEATNPPEGVTYGASFTGSGIRPTAMKVDKNGVHNYTLVRDSEYAPDSGEALTGSGQSPAAGSADASPESEFDVLPMDEYLSGQILPSDDVNRLGTRVDPRIQDMVKKVSVDV